MQIDMEARGKRPQFFDSAETDALMTALLETMSQLWATRERLAALERVLQEAGLIEAGAVEGQALTAEDEARLEASRQAFVADAFRALSADFQSLEAQAAEIDARRNPPDNPLEK